MGFQSFIPAALLHCLFAGQASVKGWNSCVISVIFSGFCPPSHNLTPLSLSVAAAFISHRTILLSLSSAVISALRGPCSYSHTRTNTHTQVAQPRQFSKVRPKCSSVFDKSSVRSIREWGAFHCFSGGGAWRGPLSMWLVVTHALCFCLMFLTLPWIRNLYPETSVHTLNDNYLSLTVRGSGTQAHAQNAPFWYDIFSKGTNRWQVAYKAVIFYSDRTNYCSHSVSVSMSIHISLVCSYFDKDLTQF